MRLFSQVFLSLCGLVLVCNLTSCGGTPSPPVSATVNSPPIPSPSPPETFNHEFQHENVETSVALPTFSPAQQVWPLVYVLKTRSVPYWQRMERAALDWSEKLGVNLTVVGSDHPQTTEFVEEQILLINQQLEAGTLKGLLLGPADSLQLVPIVEKAVAQGFRSLRWIPL